MKFRFFFSAFFALTLISANLNAQGPGIVIDSAVGQAGQTVCIPVRAKGFVDVITMQCSISWNQQVLQYDKTQNYALPGMSSANFISPQVGQLLFSWADPSAWCITLDDDEVVFEMCFLIIGLPGSSSNIEIDTAEIMNCWGNLLSLAGDLVATFWVTTSTDVSNPALLEQPTFTLTPNPASSSARVMVQSQKENEAKLFVTNTLGQTVFQQKTSISIGENNIEIPAEALKAAGIYQVSLQTEQGTTSRLLIVN